MLHSLYYMRLSSIILCLLLSLSAYAQNQPTQLYSKAQLEAKRKEILDAIGETERQLDAIKKDKNATLGQLRALQNKLADRQRLISNINDEMDDIDKTIKLSSREVGTLKQRLDILKVRYAQSIRYAYESRGSYNMLAFIFSSSDFNDAMRRMKYLKKFREYRKQQVDQIRMTQDQLQHKIGTLAQQKTDKEKLVLSQEQQKQVLEQETKEKNQTIEGLKGKEGQLLKDIEKNRLTTVRINNAINVYIEKEMAEAQRKAEEAAKKLAAANPKAPGTTSAVTPIKPIAGKEPATSPGMPKFTPHTKTHTTNEAPALLLAPTDVALAENFEGNKGKLYWPVDKGYITDHFGRHPHPAVPTVIIENYGIDIQTTQGAPVKAVFDGTVTKVFSPIGSNWVIMVKHGNFFTVYSGLQSTNVKVDDQVRARQVLGIVAENDEHQPTINFQIWQFYGKNSKKNLNPEPWLGRAH